MLRPHAYGSFCGAGKFVRAKRSVWAAVDVEPGESSQRVPQVVNRMAKEAAAMGTFRGDQPVRTPTLGHADVVSSTLDGLGKVLHRMYDQVQSDEEVFSKFKQKMLENELSKASTQVEWPTIKSLVKAEINTGRARIQQMISRFKLQVLDVVQKGLDSLRADLRATVASSFATSQHPPGLDGVVGALATAPTSRQKHEEKLETEISRLEAKRASTASGLSSSDKAKLRAARQELEKGRGAVDWDDVNALTNSLVYRIPVDDKAKQDIKAFVAKKINETNAARAETHKLTVAENHTGVEDYGETALQALQDLQSALKGKLSMRDLRAEVSDRLEAVSKQFLRHPSPAGKQALEELRSSVVAALQGMEDAAKQHVTPNGPPQSNSRPNVKADTHAARAQHESQLGTPSNQPRFQELTRTRSAVDASLKAAADTAKHAAEVADMTDHINSLHREATASASRIARSVPTAALVSTGTLVRRWRNRLLKRAPSPTDQLQKSK